MKSGYIGMPKSSVSCETVSRVELEQCLHHVVGFGACIGEEFGQRLSGHAVSFVQYGLGIIRTDVVDFLPLGQSDSFDDLFNLVDC